MDQRYAGYHVLGKWNSVSFDDTTRAVLRRRLDDVPPRRFFTEDEWRVLDALVARILPQPERALPVPVTPWIDAGLFAGQQEGFRYAGTPPVRDAWRQGLAAIEQEARLRYETGFAQLDGRSADALLRALEQGGADPDLWRGMDAAHFFIHVLVKRVAAVYYSHPQAWSEVGFGGPASPRGYVRLGFDTRDPWEAKERP
ncbi:gluconate 2-dehydrogenase subunit 3 family protein [Massilia horti]|uniref:Gluconate 2-dehydrogenase subunit 3 family protein n=1 Tax=Massilia horti TaxID=2562153 RepID=A0A4Y9T921_9BURK|nr:gluconate 2-dehydrogenase subunit 3 family protein [Massilia horti]TFW34608.1 gluconate 2-dehydrogenase subunit 3 family protein [Massilia horti]